MNRFKIALCVMAATLAGCATPPPAQTAAVPWQDAAFGYEPARVTVTRENLFRLDPELDSRLRQAVARGLGPEQRLTELVSTIFGPTGELRFGYEAGHSTIAAETWKRKSGDCLSLTVLTYAVARTLGMSPQMQEVQVPAIFDRRGQIDYVNRHVNVFFPRARRELAELRPSDVVIDFEPNFSTGRRGVYLSEEDIVARYYNNVAVEAFANGDRQRAYAHFRAAMKIQPAYGAPYANLAVLYRAEGRDADAEVLLRLALRVQPGLEIALDGLHRMLVEQGRTAEAERVNQELQARQANDPYYWMSRGLQALADAQPREAVAAFERAKEIAAGFQELHWYLAVAHSRAGQMAEASDDLRQYAKEGVNSTKMALLKRKIGLAPP